MRVIAFQSFNDGVLRSHGEGELLGKLEPSSGLFSGTKQKNPCIKLDNGKYVWGYQCYFIEKDAFDEKFTGLIKKTIIVDVPENIEPKL